MNNNYKLSFTSNSLHLEETIKVAEVYIPNRDWSVVQEIIVNENILQKGKVTTTLREFREIKDRISNLTDFQLRLLINGNIETQKLLVFLSICKTYEFIKDFVLEVIRHKFILFQTTIFNSDYDNFYDSKAAVYDKLNLITDKTKAKMRQVLFKIISQAGIIGSTKDKLIIQPFLIGDLIKAVVEDNPEYLKVFLLSDTDIKNSVAKYG